MMCIICILIPSYFKSLHTFQISRYMCNGFFCDTVPSEVVNLQVDIPSPDQFLISWNPPHNPNGVIIRYNITVLDPLQSHSFSVAGNQSQLFVTVGKSSWNFIGDVIINIIIDHLST